jgi:hypothetical protein
LKSDGFIAVIKQAHNGPCRVIRIENADKDEAQRIAGKICGQLSVIADPNGVCEEDYYDINLRWSTLALVRESDIVSAEGFGLVMKLLHGNEYAILSPVEEVLV